MLGKTAFKTVFFPLLSLIALKFISFYSAIPKVQNEHSVEKTDAIVVFTGGYKRVQVAINLFEKENTQLLFVSGVPKGVTKHNIFKISQSKVQDLSNVYIGHAENTQENAEEVAKWAGDHNIRSIRLVTTTFHMPRALREVSLKSNDLTVMPHPVSADHIPAYAVIYYYFSEFVKLTLLEMGIPYPEKQSIF